MLSKLDFSKWCNGPERLVYSRCCKRIRTSEGFDGTVNDDVVRSEKRKRKGQDHILYRVLCRPPVPYPFPVDLIGMSRPSVLD